MTSAEKIFRDAHQSLTRVIHQYCYLTRALRASGGSQVVVEGIPHPASLIAPSLTPAPPSEMPAWLESTKASSQLASTYFNTMWLIAEEAIRRAHPQKDPWELNQLEAPPSFFENLSFDKFVKIHKAVVWEISSTRNAWIYNQGIKGDEYVYRMDNKFPHLAESLASMPHFFFVDRLRSRLHLPKGETLPLDVEYLVMTQIFLLDRIALKCGYYFEKWSRR